MESWRGKLIAIRAIKAKSEGRKIPPQLDPSVINGLRNEAVDVLQEFKPVTLGQASRLAGITPADITLISIAIKRFHSPQT